MKQERAKQYERDFIDNAVEHYKRRSKEKMTQLAIARELDVNVSTLKNWLRKAGVQIRDLRAKTRWDQIDPLLGYYPDKDLADRFGLASSTICHRRQELGVDHYKGATIRRYLRYDVMRSLMEGWSLPSEIAQEALRLRTERKRHLAEVAFKNEH